MGMFLGTKRNHQNKRAMNQLGKQLDHVTECTKTGKTVLIAFYCISEFCSQHR